MSNKFGYAVIVATIVELVVAISEFRKVVEKGKKFNLMEFLAWAIGNYPRIKTAYENLEEFGQEVVDLSAEESRNAIAEIELKSPKDPVSIKIVNFLKLLVLAYSFIDQTIAGGKFLYLYGAGLFKKS